MTGRDISLEKTIPENLEAERSILGAVLLDEETSKPIFERMNSREFHLESHRKIFVAMGNLRKRRVPIDNVTLKDELQRVDELEAIGGAAYLASLTDGLPRAINVEYYAGIVKEKAALRRLIQLSDEAMQQAFNGNGSGSEAIAEKLIAELVEISKSKATGFEPPAHWRMSDFATARDWQCIPLQPIIKDLGIFKGCLIFLAAMSQTGKTLLVLYLIRRMISGGLCFGRFTVDTVSKLLYFVLEDPDRRIQSRWLDHNEPDIEPGRAIPYIAPGFKLNDDLCFSYLESLIQTGAYEVVIIDTYQKATPGISSFNDEQQSLILHKLSELTRKHNVTIIILDHIRKGDSGKRRKEITIEDIKGTGGKAQNADTVILLERTGGKLKLTATSKDLDAPVGFLLEVAPQGSTGEKFTYAGDLEELIGAQKQKGKENRERILQAIDGEWVTREDVEKMVSMGRSTVAKHLTKLLDDGFLEKKGSSKATYYRKV